MKLSFLSSISCQTNASFVPTSAYHSDASKLHPQHRNIQWNFSPEVAVFADNLRRQRSSICSAARRVPRGRKGRSLPVLVCYTVWQLAEHLPTRSEVQI